MEMITDLFDEQVEKNPHKIALVFANKQITYFELNRRANSIANHLMKMGVKCEIPVAIAIPRSLEMIIGIFGIFKAGGAYVPINPDNPASLNSFFLNESKTHVILTTSKEEAKVQRLAENCGCKTIAIDTLLERGFIDTKLNLQNISTKDNMASILFSSGSTGKQKGICSVHRALIDFILDFKEKHGIVRDDVFVLRRFYTFGASAIEIFPILSFGGKLVLAEQSVMESYSKFCELLTNESITISTFIPGELYQFLEHKKNRDLFDSLRMIIVLGERVSLEKVISLDKNCVDRLINLYGTTEVSGAISSGIAKEEYYSVGNPIGNISVKILTENLELATHGEIGEIHLGGKRLARCYINRPDLTAEKFIANPFGTGDRLYKTGDIGKYRPDGSIEFLGRVDNQIKIRGFRVELGEIENIINTSENVITSIVLSKKTIDEQNELIAFVISENVENAEILDSFESQRQQKISIYGGNEICRLVEKFRSSIASKLPDYMMPSFFIILNKIPLTINGKTDRQLLLSLDARKYLSTTDYIPPRTEIEQILCKIWEETLQLKKVGINDNFFRIGGHSLLATKMLSRVKLLLDFSVPIKVLFEHPTILEFAKNISLCDKNTNTPKLVPQNKSKHMPLSFAQQRMWIIDKLLPGKPIYNVPLSVKLIGEIDYASLESAIKHLINRHESLRTNFIESSNGEAQQVVSDSQEFSLTIIETTEKEVDQLLKKEAIEIFELSKDRLIRIKILKLPNNYHILSITMHHIISDAWSMSIFLSELTKLYNLRIKNAEPILEELPIAYTDYAVWQRSWLRGEQLEKQLHYWQKHLKNAQHYLDLPYDFKRPLDMKYEGRKYTIEIPQTIYNKTIELSERSNTTIFMIIFAAVSTLFHKYTNQTEIILGTPIANRHYRETEELIGFFANTLALKTIFGKNDTFFDVLNNVKESVLLGYENQDIPFEYLVDHLNIPRQLNVNPLFQVMVLASKDNENELLKLDNILLEKIETEHVVSKFDLIFFAKEINNKFYIEIEYSTELFKKETIEKLSEHFCNLLEKVTFDEAQKISDIDILSAEEKHKLLVEWNSIENDCLSTKCIHELFEKQVANNPDSIAAVFEGKQLTYGELNERSNQLAHYLRKKGVKTETLVALCVERSLDMLIGILGILKAGGAYVPLDPSYPDDRLKYMLDDTGASILLTQEKLQDKTCKFLTSEIDSIKLDSDWNKINKEPAENPCVINNPLNLAYIIYTSGSTGKPKGVQIPHKNITKLFETTYQIFDFKQSDVWSCFHSYAFDFSVWEMFGAILFGAKILLISYEKSRYMDEFCRYVSYQNVTLLSQTPSAFYQFSNNSQKIDFPLLRYIVFGGEALDFSKTNSWFGKHGDSTKLINMYGITEITVHATYFEVENRENESSIIGKKLQNLTGYILDDNVNLSPIGVVGEIYIGGSGLSRGYLNRPDLTAEKFIANPFGNGERLYKTGDIGRYLFDGNIEYLGRIDNQVKIRGFRIELGEIENAINACDTVIESIALTKFDENKNAYLIAYITVKLENEKKQALLSNAISHMDDVITIYSGEHVANIISDIQLNIGKILPEYMVPARFICLNKFPLTENGKIDKNFLINIDDTNRFSEDDYTQPVTETEKVLCAIWEEVLRLNKVGINDNFFKIGGDSILAIQVVSKARQKNLSLLVKDIFSHQTIKNLSSVVTTYDGEEFYFDQSSDESMFDIDFEAEKESIMSNILWKK